MTWPYLRAIVVAALALILSYVALVGTAFALCGYSTGNAELMRNAELVALAAGAMIVSLLRYDLNDGLLTLRTSLVWLVCISVICACVASHLTPSR